MKTRLGFVSNSSSTSFYCSICEKKEEHLGDVEFYEAGMFRCEDHHTFHEDCLPDGMKIYFEENYHGNILVPKSECPICTLKIIPKWYLLKYIEETTDLDMYLAEIKERFNSLDELKQYLGICRG